MKNKINLKTLFLLTGLLLFFFSAESLQAKICVVVSSSSTNTVSEGAAKKIFSGKKFNWESGNKIVIIDQKDNETAKNFYKQFLGISIQKNRSNWLKVVLSGKSIAPTVCKDAKEVKEKLAENPDAIAYIDESEVDDSVKVLFTI